MNQTIPYSLYKRKRTDPVKENGAESRSAFCERGKSLKFRLLAQARFEELKIITGVIQHDFENQTSRYRSAGSVALRDDLPLHRTIAAHRSRGPRAPDAFRLCSSYIPDPGRVEQQNRSDLSDASRLVFEQSASPVASRSK